MVRLKRRRVLLTLAVLISVVTAQASDEVVGDKLTKKTDGEVGELSHKCCSKTCKKTEPKPLVSPSIWKGSSASLGFTINTGNTREVNGNAGFNIFFLKGRWQNEAEFTAQFGSSDNIVNKEKYYAQNQLNYAFNKKRSVFVFLNANGTVDKFSPFDYQFIGMGGFGKDIINTKKVLFSLQAGPGYRRNKITSTGVVTDQVVLSSTAKIIWNITKSAQFTQSVRYDIGDTYNYLYAVSAFSNRIIDHLAVQINFIVDNYSKIPPNSKNTLNTDTTTTIALVYTI